MDAMEKIDNLIAQVDAKMAEIDGNEELQELMDLEEQQIRELNEAKNNTKDEGNG